MTGGVLKKPLNALTDLSKFIDPATGKPNSNPDSCVLGETFFD